MDVRPADILVMKKPHPCGEKIFEITRVGMDVKLRCTGCAMRQKKSREAKKR